MPFDEPLPRLLGHMVRGASVPEAALLAGIPVEEARRLVGEAMLAVGATSRLELLIHALRDGALHHAAD